MTEKRNKLLVFSIIFLIISIGLASAQESQDKGFFSQVWDGIKYVASHMTGWASSFANVFLDIQASVDAPENLSIYVYDQSTGETTLNWSNDTNAVGYYIWYSSNLTEILLINYSDANTSEILAPNVTLVGRENTTWNDTDAASVSQRYYAVAGYLGNQTTSSDTKLGKYNLTVNSEDNIKQTFLSTPLIETIPVVTFIPPNDFSMVYSVNHTLNNTWDYAYSLSGVWYGPITELEFSRGYILDDFSAIRRITSAGIVPTGNVTRTIFGEDNIKQTTLGWESITTNGSVPSLITPPNDFSMIYTVNTNANDTWDYAYSLSGVWYGPLTYMSAERGYIFDDFSTLTNLTYERNP